MAGIGLARVVWRENTLDAPGLIKGGEEGGREDAYLYLCSLIG